MQSFFASQCSCKLGLRTSFQLVRLCGLRPLPNILALTTCSPALCPVCLYNVIVLVTSPQVLSYRIDNDIESFQLVWPELNCIGVQELVVQARTTALRRGSVCRVTSPPINLALHSSPVFSVLMIWSLTDVEPSTPLSAVSFIALTPPWRPLLPCKYSHKASCATPG